MLGNAKVAVQPTSAPYGWANFCTRSLRCTWKASFDLKQRLPGTNTACLATIFCKGLMMNGSRSSNNALERHCFVSYAQTYTEGCVSCQQRKLAKTLTDPEAVERQRSPKP